MELADIFRRYGPAYRAKFGARMPPSHLKAMAAIEACRTAALGGHVYQCPACDETRYSYHSCQNRHCPKCQHAAGQRWLDKQQALLLPVPYFMLTFTLPAALRNLARRNQRLFYNLLFRASAAASQELARAPRFVGGAIGMIGVLHILRLRSGPALDARPGLPSARALSGTRWGSLCRWAAVVAHADGFPAPGQGLVLPLPGQVPRRFAQD